MLVNKQRGLSVIAAYLTKKFGYTVTVHHAINLTRKEEVFVVKDSEGNQHSYSTGEMLILLMEMLEEK